MQDTFLLAYKGLINYIEPLRMVRSLVKINMTEFVHWRTFEWHWEKLADLIDYLPDILTKFQVEEIFRFVNSLFKNISFRILLFKKFFPMVKQSTTF